ncbi:MAG: hypothetical protein AAF404_18175 [Pseudomonadota bacterium]
MKTSTGLLGFAALAAALNAIVHIGGSAMAGFSMIPLVAGVVWLVFAAGLNAGMRWLAYFAFLFAIAGAITAYATALSGALPTWAGVGIIVLNCLLCLLLFLSIWRAPVRAAA